MAALLSRGSARFGLLIALVVVFYLTYRHTIWMPRPGQLPEASTLLPVTDELWHSVGWLAFTAILLVLFATRVRPMPASSDISFRRLVLLTLVATYAVTVWQRLATGRTIVPDLAVAPEAVAAAALVALAGAAALILRPPPTPWLLALLFGGGVALRLALFVLVRPDPAFADNLPAVEKSLERLVGGLTPYAIHDFGSHTNPMPYLPLTFLSYLPAYLLGLDIRVTNLVLTSALTIACWLILRALPLPVTTRNGLALMVALLFALPERLSKDVYVSWPPFNLFFVLVFGLIVLGRLRPAAVAYGASLAAMPHAIFAAPPLLVLAVRTRPLREVAVLAAIVAVVGALPTLLFIAWDVDAFFSAVGFATAGLWGDLAAGESALPLLLWHGWLGGWLFAVQLALLGLAAVVSWTRLRSVRGLIGLTAVLYLWLVITGPHIAQYMTTVVLYLALLEEAARATGTTAGDRELGLASDPRARSAAAHV